MESRHKNLLKRSRRYLEANLSADDDFITAIWSQSIISDEDKQSIHYHPGGGRRRDHKERVTAFLEILPSKGRKAFDVFINELQEHSVAGNQELAEYLLTELSRSAASTQPSQLPSPTLSSGASSSSESNALTKMERQLSDLADERKFGRDVQDILTDSEMNDLAAEFVERAGKPKINFKAVVLRWMKANGHEPDITNGPHLLRYYLSQSEEKLTGSDFVDIIKTIAAGKAKNVRELLMKTKFKDQ